MPIDVRQRKKKEKSNTTMGHILIDDGLHSIIPKMGNKLNVSNEIERNKESTLQQKVNEKKKKSS